LQLSAGAGRDRPKSRSTASNRPTPTLRASLMLAQDTSFLVVPELFKNAVQITHYRYSAAADKLARWWWNGEDLIEDDWRDG